MWGLWFFPLVRLSFYVGLAVAVLWYLLRAFAGKRPKIPVAVAVAVAVPFGCAALPIIALTLVAAVGALFQKSDAQLYEEVFGHEPALGEDRMLFDDFGNGADRQIYMRAEPTGAEREKMLAMLPLRASALTLDEFAALGARHGFTWWISSDPQSDHRCKSARIREPPGFRGWREFRVAECLDGGPDFPADMSMRYVYVAASGRP
jgi:heme A synthase